MLSIVERTNVVGKLASAFGAAPPSPVTSAHDYYNRAFVEPAGPPETKIEKQIRGATRSFGTDAPALLLSGGLSAAGARSGVTPAEQMAPGLLDKIRAPANSVAHIVDPNNPTVREAMGFVATKLRDMVPNSINALHPSNVANAVRASNVQGAADATLRQIARRPARSPSGILLETGAVRNGVKRKTQRKRLLRTNRMVS